MFHIRVYVCVLFTGAICLPPAPADRQRVLRPCCVFVLRFCWVLHAALLPTHLYSAPLTDLHHFMHAIWWHHIPPSTTHTYTHTLTHSGAAPLPLFQPLALSLPLLPPQPIPPPASTSPPGKPPLVLSTHTVVAVMVAGTLAAATGAAAAMAAGTLDPGGTAEALRHGTGGLVGG